MLWLVALALAQPGSPGPQWARFTRVPAFQREAVEVRVGTVLPAAPGRPLDYWFERRIVARGARDRLSWADTRSCPAARAALGRMAEVEPPHFRPPGFGGDEVVVIADGVSYTLEAPAEFEDGQLGGDLRIRSNVGTSLARWVEAMLAALSPCWTGRRPPPAPLTSH